MTKPLRYSGEDLKPERAPQANRRRISFDHCIELHRPVTVFARLVKDMTAEGPSHALLPPGRVDNESSVGDMSAWPRVVGMSVRATDDASIVDGDNGASRQFAHPAGACPGLGDSGIPRQGLARFTHLFQNRPDSGPVCCARLTYHHAGKHRAARPLLAAYSACLGARMSPEWLMPPLTKWLIKISAPSLMVRLCLALLLLYGLLKDAQQGTRCSRRKLRRLFREFDEDADPSRPAARRPLAEATAPAAAGELFPPGGTVGLVLLIAHLWLSEPERVAIGYLAALIPEPT